MGHAHDHTHGLPDADGESSRRIRVAFLLNLSFAIVEIFGGLWTNSVAILSDAVHDLGDSLSLGTAWVLDRYAQRQGDELFSYGYKRFSLLGALINTLVLIVGSLLVLSEAVPRLLDPQHSDAQGMILFAVLGIAVNGIAVWRMHGGRTLNERVVAWHLLEDVLGWGAVLIVAVVMLFYDIHILDPILSILITLYILWNVIGNLKRTMMLFLQGVPEEINPSRIESDIAAMDRVCGIHHTHVWSLDGETHVLTTHVVVPDGLSQAAMFDVREAIKQRLAHFDIQHATIELETESEGCVDAYPLTQPTE